MSDDEVTFETGDAGASHTQPVQAGDVKKGGYVMLKDHPCKVSEYSTSKTGKHGHAKAHIVGFDIFTGKKYEDLCPASHNMNAPFVTRTEMQLLAVNDDDSVSLLLPDGSGTKDDLNCPDMAIPGAPDPTDEDGKVTEQMKKMLDEGKDVIVAVLGACGTEKIVAAREKA